MAIKPRILSLFRSCKPPSPITESPFYPNIGRNLQKPKPPSPPPGTPVHLGSLLPERFPCVFKPIAEEEAEPVVDEKPSIISGEGPVEEPTLYLVHQHYALEDRVSPENLPLADLRLWKQVRMKLVNAQGPMRRGTSITTMPGLHFFKSHSQVPVFFQHLYK